MYVPLNIHAHVFILLFVGKGRRSYIIVLGVGEERGQNNNKVSGETHLFSTYHFNGASQSMIDYKYMQDERSARGET